MAQQLDEFKVATDSDWERLVNALQHLRDLAQVPKDDAAAFIMIQPGMIVAKLKTHTMCQMHARVGNVLDSAFGAVEISVGEVPSFSNAGGSDNPTAPACVFGTHITDPGKEMVIVRLKGAFVAQTTYVPMHKWFVPLVKMLYVLSSNYFRCFEIVHSTLQDQDDAAIKNLKNHEQLRRYHKNYNYAVQWLSLFFTDFKGVYLPAPQAIPTAASSNQ